MSPEGAGSQSYSGACEAPEEDLSCIHFLRQIQSRYIPPPVWGMSMSRRMYVGDAGTGLGTLFNLSGFSDHIVCIIDCLVNSTRAKEKG